MTVLCPPVLLPLPSPLQPLLALCWPSLRVDLLRAFLVGLNSPAGPVTSSGLGKCLLTFRRTSPHATGLVFCPNADRLKLVYSVKKCEVQYYWKRQASQTVRFSQVVHCTAPPAHGPAALFGLAFLNMTFTVASLKVFISRIFP